MASILAFAGSTRKDSFNKKLVRIAAKGARDAGADVTDLDLAEFPLPLYDGDLEAAQGLPENVQKLKALFKDHDALLISSPEYNSSITAVLKNVIDWVSRPADGEKPLACLAGKSAALVAASPGALGGLRGLVHLRSILSNIQITVIPDQRAISGAAQAFDESGQLKDAKQQESILKVGAKLAAVAERLKA